MASGGTLREVLAMPLPEFEGWADFIADNPPGDVRLQLLVARLCSLFYSANKPKRGKSLDEFDFAPWLRPPKRDTEGPDAKAVDENRAQVLELQARLRAERKALE